MVSQKSLWVLHKQAIYMWNYPSQYNINHIGTSLKKPNLIIVLLFLLCNRLLFFLDTKLRIFSIPVFSRCHLVLINTSQHHRQLVFLIFHIKMIPRT